MSTVDPAATVDPELTDPVDPVDPETPVDPAPEGADKPELVRDLVEQRKALRAEKAALKARLEALEAEVANKDKPAEEKALDDARREARREAQAGFNQRLVTAELKAALAGKVNNAALALRVIDTSVIDVDDNGEVDAQSVTDAIDALLAEYPELAGASVPVTKRRIPDVAADPANKVSTPASLSDRIAAAQKAGDTATFIALQNQLLQQQ